MTTEIDIVYAGFVNTLHKYFLALSLSLSFLFLSQTAIFAAAPSNGGWTTVGSMATRRIVFSSTLLQNGEVLVAGGRPSQSEPLIAFTELYNPSTKTWSTTGNLNTPRQNNDTQIVPNLVTLQNGKALIVGGSDVDATAIDAAELYDPSTGIWTNTGSLNTSRREAGVIVLNDGRVLAAGGVTGLISGTILTSSELYDPTTGTWSYTANDLAIQRDFPTLTKLQDGRVLLVGGHQADGSCTNSEEIFDPTTNTWSSAGTMPWGAVGITTTLLPDGRVFAVGGGCPESVANSAIYNPSTNSWTATASMPQARQNDESFLLSDGRVLVAGGSDLSSSIIYDPNTNTWSNGSSLNTLRTAFAISPLSNGDILAVGGWVSDPSQPSDTFANAELYVPAPSVSAITAPSSPVLVNTAITASASFTDQNTNPHTATWDWGDTTTSNGTVTESNGSGSVSDSHTYTATGVYTITLTVTNSDGVKGTSTYQYVAVYDSSTSFAGGRSFDNPSSASPNTTGKVTFGISAKYNNSNVLTGSAKMNFKAANIDFASTSLTSLATSNGRAYLKGSGTFNGTSGYTFLATGIDGSVVGGNDLIRFQIKDASGNVVYDSQPGASDTADPTTVDATGNIRVH